MFLKKNMRFIILHLILELYVLIRGEEYISSGYSHLPEQCGKTRFDSKSFRIVGGETAALGQFPWMAKIGYRKNNGIFFYCGGSIINKYYVLTAAHCEAKGDVVRLGENYLDTAPDCDEQGDCAPLHQDIGVKHYIFHTYAHKETHHNDIALIELEEAIEFNDFVKPICLPEDKIPHDKLIGRNVVIAGWGMTNSSDPKSHAHILMYFHSAILDLHECEYIKSENHLVGGQFCIGFDEAREKCVRDCGSPVTVTKMVNGVSRAYQIGIVATESNDCRNSPAVCTDVSYYMDWIVDAMQRGLYPEEIYDSPLPEDCGRVRPIWDSVEPQDEDIANLGEFPWMAKIGTKIDNQSVEFFCTGSLVSELYVLSVATCGTHGNIVRVGENYLFQIRDCDLNGCAPLYQDIAVKSYILSIYTKSNLKGDISLIELSKPAKLSDFVQPVCLPVKPFTYEDETAEVVGWGDVDPSDNGYNFEYLKHTTVSTLHGQDCKYNRFTSKIGRSQLCIGGYREGMDSCNGDSGGPVTMHMKMNGQTRSYQVGLVSFGSKDCGISAAVYTDVTYYVDWILDQIKRG